MMRQIFSYSIDCPKLIIRRTNKYGYGVFAAEDIRCGKIIYVLSGEKIDVSTLILRVNTDKENIDDPLQIGKRTYIDLDKISRTFNHSCNPNAGLKKVSELFALTDISRGEEITYDYSLTIAPTNWKMECICGSNICRKIIGDISTIPLKRLEEYIKMGALQEYMKKIIKSIIDGSYKKPEYEIKALKSLKKTSNF